MEIKEIKLLPAQNSPVDIVSNKSMFEIIEHNLCLVAEKINELILILNSDTISEKKKAGRPKKEIDENVNG